MTTAAYLCAEQMGSPACQEESPALMTRLLCCILARSAQHDSAIRQCLRPSTAFHDHLCRHDITQYCEGLSCRIALAATAPLSPAPCRGSKSMQPSRRAGPGLLLCLPQRLCCLPSQSTSCSSSLTPLQTAGMPSMQCLHITL